MHIKDMVKFFLAVLMLGGTIALAAFDPVNDDTDIFLANPNIPAERPNVLLVIDNTANWNSAFANEKNAMVQVVNGLTDQYNVGLMIMSDANIKRSGSTADDGAFVRYHVRQMTTTNKTALSNLINGFSVSDDKGDNNLFGLALYEAYLYFGGKASRAGDDQSKADHDGTSDTNLNSLSGHALPGAASASFPDENALYRSPVLDGCQRNFIIFISNGPAGENTNALAALEGYLGDLTGVSPPAVIPISPNGQQASWADEMAKFMANADVVATDAGVPNSAGVQNVYTYVVEVDPGTTGQGDDMTALAKSVAANGKGKYFGVTSSASGTAIVDALNQIFTEVQAVNSVFASTTLPVSVNVRGTNLNQVYIGVFRPDSTKSPRWLGNLKMYNLALNTATGTVFLADAENGPPPAVGSQAENSTTGFVSQNSPSFWTKSSSFWAFRDASQNGPGGSSDLPDGDLVEKGGAAQQLREAFAGAEASAPGRNLYTCTTGLVGVTNQACVPLDDFALSNTPFTTANAAITPGTLQLDTRLVSPLTALETKAVTLLTDRTQASLNNTNPATSVAVSSLSNGATTRTITNLTTATPRVINTVTSDVAGTRTRTITSIAKSGPDWVVAAAGALPAEYVAGAFVTFFGFTSANRNNWNGVTRQIESVNTGANTFIVDVPSGNPGGVTSGDSSVPATTPSTTAQVNMPNHGFSSLAQVTISGASPTEYNRANVTITVPLVSGSPDPNNFTYPLQTAPASTGFATGTITVAGNTNVATATTSGAHGFAHGSFVTITGASISQYNGTKQISCTPAPDCTGATKFTYSTGTVVGPNTSTTIYAVQGASNTVTVTTAVAHGFANGDPVTISGSDIAGYNGTFAIACDPAPGCVGATTFTYDPGSLLPANTSGTVTASAAGATLATVTVTAANHGFATGDTVVIESIGAADTNHPGTYTPITVTDANTFTYVTAAALPAPSGLFTVRPPTASLKAIATVTAHGYGSAGDTKQVFINGALPAVYNKASGVTATIVDANTFTYPLSGIPSGDEPGQNTSTAVTSSIKTTTARATSVNHGFVTGSKVTIAGATPSAFNTVDTTTDFTITVVDADTFTYTIPSAEGNASGTVTAGQATGSNDERDAIIRWVRGEDNFQDENSNSSTSDIRASVHGDVLHSRPAVVNYNRYFLADGVTKSDDDVFVYYGGNDGIFHAVKGGYAKPASDPSTLTPGQEAWGFVPSEFFSKFKRMRNNSPAISSAFKRPYFMDGPIGIYTNDADDNGALGDTGDAVNLYIANRRGGRFLYALDVNAPTNPKFLWKIDSGTTGFSELGQTWSQPTVVTGLAGLTVPVLVFGAGYDETVEDIDPSAITSVNTTTGAVTTAAGTFTRSMGRGIYVVNALTGALIWRALGTGTAGNDTTVVPGMVYAIPSDITVVRNESGGFTNRAYVGDTGGNLWRIDFRTDSTVTGPNLVGTTVTKLASIADTTTTGTITDPDTLSPITVLPGLRKFLFPPDVVGDVGFDMVLIGSGDREHPFDISVKNRFYMFKDRGGDSGPATGVTGSCDPTITEGSIPDGSDSCTPNPGDIPGLSDLTSNCIQNVDDCIGLEDQDAVAAKLAADRGWFITLGAGEKVVGNAISIGGTTFFNTNQPDETAGGGTCGSNLGVARQYQVATADATSTSDLNAVGGLTGADRSLIHAGGGYLPSPVHVVVMLGGKPVEAVISGIQVSTPPGASLSARLRKFWYKEVDQK